ncbi:MAG: EAL domain-containing protein, partial [Acidobacteriota bacterium]
DLISILDPDGRVLFQRLSSARLLGQPSEEVVGQDLRSLLHPEDHGVFDQALVESLGEPGGTASVQVRFRHRGGDWCYFESLCKNLVDNPVLGGVVITSRDVTERRQVEIALKRERAFFQQLFRNSPAGIVILDTNDRVVDANRSFVDLFQFEIQDLAGKPLNDSIVPVDLLDEASELSRLVQENQSIDRETIRSRKDGSKVDVSILGYPIELAERRIGAYGIYSDITERKSAERQLFHEAFHDPLTGLPNRALMTERLERDLRRAKRREDYQFALLFIDLDGFKAVNDNLGHAAGDELLVEVAQRLGACLRPGDTVARLGGDEFTIILEDIKEPGDATRIAGRILESLAQPFPIAGQEVRSAGSIGIAYSSTGYGQAEDLLRDADIAMYRAKTHGKARFEIFDTAMQETARQKQSLEVALGHALERGEIVLVYQPVVSLRGGALTGFEALARWRHPEKGLLLPAQWLPIALETKGLLEAVSQRVVSEACLQLAAWQKAFPERDAVRLSINVAPREASLGGWAQDLSAACKAAGCHPGSLVLEFTEELLALENSGGPELLWDLHKHGFRIWLDDFGTGRTSLDALSRLPIDAVKLDRMFVGALTPGTDSAEVARAVVALGHALGMVTVAEGVEQTDQADQLETLGIELAQGFHFSEPVDAAAATEMLSTDRRW